MALKIGADEKKKLYMLGGLFGVIVVVGAGLYIPNMRKGSETKGKSSPPVSPNSTPKTPAPGGTTPGASPAGGAPAAGGATGGPVSAASLVSVSQFRNDPFKLFEKKKLPPLPAPRIRSDAMRGPVAILPPSQVDDSSGGGAFPGIGLPPLDVSQSRGAIPAATAVVDLPPVSIPRTAVTPVVPQLQGDPGAGGLITSPNKRVSGVIIGDSVRAILEISDGENVTTRIVQPGDEVDGIRILRIERVTEGARTITRVIIRENGEERSVLLKAGNKNTSGGGAGGIGGAAGPGARPGAAPGRP